MAYTSVSHLGFVLLGIYAWNELALQGALMQMLAHGISTGALFVLVGALQERIHTRDLERMGGLWTPLPRLAALTSFFAIASLGLPGLGNFIGEFLVLLGSWRVSIGYTTAASLGLIAAAIYALTLVQRAFHGTGPHEGLCDLAPRHVVTLGALVLVLVWLGMFPQTVFDTARPALAGLHRGFGSAAVVVRAP